LTYTADVLRIARLTFLTALLSTVILAAACRREAARPNANVAAQPSPAATVKGEEKMTLKVTSTAFDEGGVIPAKYTCDGENVSPPLAWSGVPDGAKSLALVADDPDAPGGTWTHWVIYQIPATEKGLPENVPTRDTLDGGARQGVNDFKKTGYGGPCPPSGTHHYFFKLYALDAEPNLPPGVSKEQLLKAIDGHVVAEGQLMGRYQRGKS
jgi:Raf kinase inhibitor-like YbhB/YbcL family protein